MMKYSRNTAELGTEENSLSSTVPNSNKNSAYYVVNDRPDNSNLLNLLVMESNANAT